MRFKDFLREQQDFLIREAIVQIKQECGQFLSEIQGKNVYLYRGMNSPVTDRAMYMAHREHRDPRDSAGWFNVLFNAGIEATHDIKNARQTSIFCSGDDSEASSYGNVYLVFPKGEFQFLWSPLFADSYVDEKTLAGLFLKKAHIDKMSGNELTFVIEDILRGCTGNIATATRAFLSNDKMIDDAFKEYGIEGMGADKVYHALEEVFNLYTTHGLEDALRSRHEILITKSSGFYAIPYEGLRHEMEMDREFEGQSPEEFLDNFFFHSGPPLTSKRRSILDIKPGDRKTGSSHK